MQRLLREECVGNEKNEIVLMTIFSQSTGSQQNVALQDE